MEHKKSMSMFSVVMILFLFLLNCATFKSDLKNKFKLTPEKNYNADKVSVFFIFSHYRQTIGYDAIPRLDNERQRIGGFDDFFQDALNELSNIGRYSTYTEYAADVNTPERRALKDSLIKTHDYVMKVRFMRTKSFAKHFLGTVFSSLSITLLPIPYHYSFDVSLDLFNSDGKLVKSYSRNASLTKWTQMFLIFLYPFHPEKRKKEEIYVEFLHDIFRQIESEKVLRKSKL